MKNILLILSISTILFSCKKTQEVKQQSELDNKDLSDTLTHRLQSIYNKNEAIMGFSVSVVDEDGIIYDNGFGFSNINKTKPYTSNTIQNIASISKTLLGISILKAQELGKLNINDPINKYLPFKVINPNYPETPILIKHLAYHTSSITDPDEVYSKSYVLKKSEHNDNEGVYDWFNNPETKISLLEFLENSLTESGKWYTKNSFTHTKPGEAREYSNIAAALCAQIITAATGQNYQEFTKEYILKPLKMNSSGWSEKDIDTTKRSRLFATKTLMIAEYALITYADGGFITSSKDLGLFLTELIKGYNGNGSLLYPESYELLFKKETFPNIKNGDEFGIFVEFSTEFIGIKDTLIGHNGSDPGVVTAMYFNPKTETGRILLINTDSDFDENFWPQVQSIWNALMSFETELASRKK